MNIKKLSVDNKDIEVNTGRIILPSAEDLEQINQYVNKSELEKKTVMESSGSNVSDQDFPFTDEPNINMTNSDDRVPTASPSVPIAGDHPSKGWLLSPMMLAGVCICFFALLLGIMPFFLMNGNIQAKDTKILELSEQRNGLLFESLSKENSELKEELHTLKLVVEQIDQLQREQVIETASISKAVDIIEASIFIDEDEEESFSPEGEVYSLEEGQ